MECIKVYNNKMRYTSAKNRQVTISIPAQTYTDLQKLAYVYGYTPNHLIGLALVAYVRENQEDLEKYDEN